MQREEQESKVEKSPHGWNKCAAGEVREDGVDRCDFAKEKGAEE